VLKSGRALQKFIEIVEAQSGVVPKGDVPVGRFVEHITATDSGYVAGINNKAVVQIARATGSPKDKGAGLIVHHKRGDKLVADEPILTIYAESEYKLREAVALAKKHPPVRVEGMLLQRIPEIREI
jgi:AMP phosphorylase